MITDPRQRSVLQVQVPTHIRPLHPTDDSYARLERYLQDRIAIFHRHPHIALWRRWRVQARLPADPFHDHLLTTDYEPAWLHRQTRKVFFDIETLFLPSDLPPELRDASYRAHQQLGIAVTIDEDGEVRCWESDQAAELVTYLLSFDEVVSYNGLQFDNAVLSGHIDPEVIQTLYNRSFDLMWFCDWVTSARYHRSLDANAMALINSGKESLSAKAVPKVLREGTDEEQQRVWHYCFKDVHLLVRMYRALRIDLRMKRHFVDWFLRRIEEEVPSQVSRYVTRAVVKRTAGEEIPRLQRRYETACRTTSRQAVREIIRRDPAFLLDYRITTKEREEQAAKSARRDWYGREQRPTRNGTSGDVSEMLSTAMQDYLRAHKSPTPGHGLPREILRSTDIAWHQSAKLFSGYTIVKTRAATYLLLHEWATLSCFGTKKSLRALEDATNILAPPRSHDRLTSRLQALGLSDKILPLTEDTLVALGIASLRSSMYDERRLLEVFRAAVEADHQQAREAHEREVATMRLTALTGLPEKLVSTFALLSAAGIPPEWDVYDDLLWHAEHVQSDLEPAFAVLYPGAAERQEEYERVAGHSFTELLQTLSGRKKKRRSRRQHTRRSSRHLFQLL